MDAVDASAAPVPSSAELPSKVDVTEATPTTPAPLMDALHDAMQDVVAAVMAPSASTVALSALAATPTGQRSIVQVSSSSRTEFSFNVP